MNEVDRLIQELERRDLEATAFDGSSPTLTLAEFILLLKNLRNELFGPRARRA